MSTLEADFFVQTDALVSVEPLRIRRAVRWVECDPAGIVHTPRFLDYAVSAYETFLGFLIGGKLHSTKSAIGIDFPAKAVSLNFSSRISVDDIFVMTVRVGTLRNRTFDIVVEAGLPDGARAFTAVLTPICFDPATGRAVSIPDTMRCRLEAYARNHPASSEGATA